MRLHKLFVIKPRIALGLLAPITVACLGACSSDRQAAEVGPAELAVPGSGTCEQVVSLLAQAYEAATPGTRVTVPPSIGSTGGIAAVGEGKAELARVGRRPKASESRYGLAYHEFARDALVFAVGAGVEGVRGLTLDQVSNIYAGAITNWSDVGGPDRPINLILREKDETTRQELAKAIPGLSGEYGPEQAKIVYRDFEVLELLEKFPAAIGFTTMSNLRSGTGRWTVLALDGVDPDAASLASGAYPYSLDMGLVYPAKGCSARAKAFIEFVGSPQGAAVVRANGMVPAGKAR